MTHPNNFPSVSFQCFCDDVREQSELGVNSLDYQYGVVRMLSACCQHVVKPRFGTSEVLKQMLNKSEGCEFFAGLRRRV